MNAPLTTSRVRRDPMVPFTSLFDELFDDFWRPAWLTARLPEMPTVARARMDVVDKGESFMITVELPGVTKEDINVAIAGPRVSITAEAKEEKETKEGDRLLHTERYATSYARSFELPVEVTEDGAEAHFENGVLTLTLPKRVPETSKRLMVR